MIIIEKNKQSLTEIKKAFNYVQTGARVRDGGIGPSYSEINDKIEQLSLVDNTAISASSTRVSKPVCCLTFDDGPDLDYTMTKPALDAFGVVGTVYVNSIDDDVNALTDAHIVEMSEAGWEFGSHTTDHASLAPLALNKTIAINDTEIEFINTSSAPFWMPTVDGMKFYVESTDNIFTAVGYSLSSSVLTLTLDTPSTINISTIVEGWLHEDAVLPQILGPRNKLELLGVPCPGLAYPWGNVTQPAKSVVQQNFAYSRSASGTYSGGVSGSTGANGGIYDGDYSHFDQYEITAFELIESTDEEIDIIVDVCASSGSMLVPLMHSNSGATIITALNKLIPKLQAAGIEIMTVSNALKYKGNVASFGDSHISEYGTCFGLGFTAVERGRFTSDANIGLWPLGISLMRVYGVVERSGTYPFPADGICVTHRTKLSGIATWSFQMFYEQTTNRVWRRNTISASVYTEWVRLDGIDSGAIRPTDVTDGSQFLDTVIGKPIWYLGTGWIDSNGVTV